MSDDLTDLVAHVHRKVSIAAGICYGGRNENICGLLLLFRVAGDGMRVEEDVKNEYLWLCHPFAANDVVSTG